MHVCQHDQSTTTIVGVWFTAQVFEWPSFTLVKSREKVLFLLYPTTMSFRTIFNVVKFVFSSWWVSRKVSQKFEFKRKDLNNVFAQECNGRSSCSWIVKIFPAQSKGRDASWLVLETTHHRNCWWAREESVEITKSKLGLPPERRIIKARNSDQKKLNGNTFKQRFTFENYSINKLKAGATLPSVNKTTKNQLNKTKQFPRSKTSQTGVPWTRLTAGQGSSLHLCDME